MILCASSDVQIPELTDLKSSKRLTETKMKGRRDRGNK